MFDQLDAMYWLFRYQAGALPIDWYDEHEDIFDRMFISHDLGPTTDLWRPGSLTAFGAEIRFDEWSMHFGFHAGSDAEAVKRAEIIDRSKLFSEEFYKMWETEGRILAMHADGWWEFYTGDDQLFAAIKECPECRAMQLRGTDPMQAVPPLL